MVVAWAGAAGEVVGWFIVENEVMEVVALTAASGHALGWAYFQKITNYVFISETSF
jgi:hypothetical protein